MKRFTKMLALGMAVALTFGMTVSAKWSPSTDAVGALEVDSKKVVYSPMEDEERIEVAEKALEVAPGMLKGSSLCDSVTKMAVSTMDAYALRVMEGSNVTYRTPGRAWDYDHAKAYGHTWGYAMVRFDMINGKLAGQELIKMDRTGEGEYVAWLDQRNQKEYAFYAVVRWVADLAWNPLHVDRQNTNATELWYTIMNDADALSTRLNTGLAATIAKREGFKNGVAVVGGWKSLDVEKKGDLKASLPKHGEGEKYIMVSCPYKYDGDVRNADTNIHRVDLSADVPTYYVMEDTGVNSGQGDGNELWYTAKNVDKGEQFLMVILVSDKADPVPPQVTDPNPGTSVGPDGQTSGGAGQTTGGAVSPKTGEMLPVAVILAAVCLAGAAVCAKKARTNA